MTIRVQRRFQIECDGFDVVGPSPEDVERCGDMLAPFHHPGGPTPRWFTADEVREHAERWGWQHVPVLRVQARMFARPNEPHYRSDYKPFPEGEWYCPRHHTDKKQQGVAPLL